MLEALFFIGIGAGGVWWFSTMTNGSPNLRCVAKRIRNLASERCLQCDHTYVHHSKGDCRFEMNESLICSCRGFR